uniref:histidine kinase n=1 Tax=Desulfobacca acetoxidans TaxID=60893 RepID=A0A7V4LCF9_9BACT
MSHGPTSQRETQNQAPPAEMDSFDQNVELNSVLLTEMVRYYRHAAVGRLAIGIIHNLNTPLQVVSFLLELLEQKSEEEQQQLSVSEKGDTALEQFAEYRRLKLRQLRQEVDQLRGMIQRLALQAVHEGQQEKCYLDLNRLLEDELNVYLGDPFFKHRIKKVFSFTPCLPPLYGHYIDFSQSFRNLLDNALEAMQDTENRVLTVGTAVAGNWRVLKIGDTGVGFPPEAKARLFQPFFTTKGTPEKPRAGLGLFFAKRLLAPYRAEILVESEAGETWVTVRIPIEPA